MTGTITTINERGFGFIRPDDRSGDVFFHCNELAPELPFDEQLRERRVRFDIESDPRDASRFRAKRVIPEH